ncbi:amidohydrolase family protein [Sphingobacterium spiritivorum]|uniref:amidohydrolase family protein n=1 Tax=Sphingobacterium TaxID=28453 RepID=UPI00191A9638|nr:MULTISPECIES: amidohydrolase family protein [Sphingobacterium]QQT27969.1 amidohydrolase family protein [Sphingobacterium spiritivorum]
MVKYYSGDYVLPITNLPIKRGVVAIDDSGVIQGVYANDAVELVGKKIELLNGVLIPGFINAHCHIELSYLKGAIAQRTGLPQFISAVMTSRKENEKTVIKHIEKADKLMYDNGIQAVGDHVNTSFSAAVKERSSIKYHTFVEAMGLNKDQVESRLEEAQETRYHFNDTHSSITPHAPYSCSKLLLKAFKKLTPSDSLISIHNQESEAENKLFRYKQGEFLKFYEQIGYNIADFKAQARNSIQSYLPNLPVRNKLMLVHNTYTSLKDLDFVRRMDREVVWCFCPKANLYIEGTLPKVMNFVNDDQKIVLGTDSFASNDTLDILEELKVLHEAFPALEFTKTINWATINGAEFLNFDDKLGSLEVGKKPGLILLEGMENLRLTSNVTVQRIA